MNPRYTPLSERSGMWSLTYEGTTHYPDPTAYLCKQHNELFHFGEECPSCMSEEDAAEEHAQVTATEN